MPITRKGKSNFEDYIQHRSKNMKKMTIEMLKAVGEECETEMRLQKKYLDQTNNLRSSTGFVIASGGKILVSSGFKAEGEGSLGNGAEGAKQGQLYSEALAHDTGSDQISLILVAGMDYAEYVESKGLNVMDSAVNLARRQVKEIIEELVK